jgi:hypothetical protein
MKNLLSKFHHRTNLKALLFSNLGSRNKTKYINTYKNFEIQVPKGTPFVKGVEIFVKEQFAWL